MAHRYRLYPVENQAEICTRHCCDARFVYNLALEQAKGFNKAWGPTPGPAERQRQLAEARKDSWLGQGSSSVQQQALRDFDRAMANFFSGTHAFPTWRKAGVHEGFCVRDVTAVKANAKWSTITVPKCGRVKFKTSRPLPKNYGMARITMDRSGRWHVSFTAPQPTVRRVETGQSVGVDLGVVATVTTSYAEQLSIPTLSPGKVQRLRRLQRKLSRQVKGSRRRDATKLAIGRLKAKEADCRKDFVEKVSTRFVKNYDLVCLEDLKVKNMVASSAGTIENPGVAVAAKRALNRLICTQGWSMLRRRIEDKAATCDVEVVAVNPSFTSQRCSACGHSTPKNRESQAVFACRSCNYTVNADVNAAKNILAAGLAVTARGGTPRSGPVEARTPDLEAA